MTTFDNLQKSVKKYSEIAQEHESVISNFRCEVSQFFGLVKDFMGMCKLQTLQVGVISITNCGSVKLSEPLNRKTLDEAYEEFDVIVEKAIDDMKCDMFTYIKVD